MVLKWLDEAPVEVAEDLEMPQFDMYDYKAEGCVQRYKTGGSWGVKSSLFPLCKLLVQEFVIHCKPLMKANLVKMFRA